MDCQCCGSPVGGDKKYVLFAILKETKQVAICKACLMIGMKAPIGSIIANKEVVQPPKLAFPYRHERDEFCKAAKEEGWLTQNPPSDSVIITAHYEQALLNNYFVPEGWRKNVAITSVKCFKRSCANIRDYYPQWLALKVGK